jgi:choline dehydrogenase-like flavoprotein
VVKPTSRGKVMLRAPLPDSKPRVLSNFLGSEEDRACMMTGVRMAMKIAEQPALKAVEREPFSVPASDSDDDVWEFIQRATQTVYHPTSTCAMGQVVDSELRVYGTEGLRVIDASVMPSITRGNTNAPTIMIAEKGADLVKSAAAAQAGSSVRVDG